jgi:mannose-6-phosphate isomerase
VHAIGAGILLAEVQQSSDVTYRIFDYNRPGMDGKPRELHTELAAQALDYHVESEYRPIYDENINRANLIVDSPYFRVRVTETPESFHRNLLKYDSFVITMCIEGDCTLRVRSTGDEILLKEGHSALIPAAIADYDLIPLHGKSRILDAFIDNRPTTFTHQITQLLHIER